MAKVEYANSADDWSTGAVSYNFTISSNKNRLLIIVAGAQNSGGVPNTPVVQLGGSTKTASFNRTQDKLRMCVYVVKDSALTAGSTALTMTDVGVNVLSIAEYYNCDQKQTINFSNYTTGIASSFSKTLSGNVAGSVVCAAITIQQSGAGYNPTSPTNCTEIQTQEIDSTMTTSLVHILIPTSPDTIGWTYTNNDTVAVAYNIAPFLDVFGQPIWY